MTKKDREQQAKSAETLREWLKPGDTVYTVLRHVSRSGMQRRIDLYAIIGGKPQWLSYHAAKACGWRVNTNDREGIVVGGCGMDMGFHLVYSLSHTLWPGGFGCIGEGCPSNDHSNGDRDYTPHATDEQRRGADGALCTCHRKHWHRDGGYALQHAWL